MKQYLSKYKNRIKSLTTANKKKAGRNNSGKITVYHQGGGHKRIYRKLDMNKSSKSGIITNFEYDPNRSSYIAKVCYIKNNKKSYYYILASKELNILDSIGKTVNNANSSLFDKFSSSYTLNDFNVGDYIYNIEIKPNKGGQLVRSAGTYAQLLQKNKGYATIALPSGEHRLIPLECKASPGTVSNENHKNNIIGKAGKSRWLNKRPTVRGVAMNPVDHPHGGGEGKSSGGRPSVTPWAKYTKGQPTRSKKKKNKFILKSYKLKK